MFLALDAGSGGGLVLAAQHLDERGLAGAVLAHQRVDLAGHQLQVDLIERQHAWEALADVLERRGWVRSRVRPDACALGGAGPGDARGRRRARRRWTRLGRLASGAEARAGPAYSAGMYVSTFSAVTTSTGK